MILSYVLFRCKVRTVNKLSMIILTTYVQFDVIVFNQCAVCNECRLRKKLNKIKRCEILLPFVDCR